MRYAMTVIAHEFTKTFLLFIIFSLLGYFKLFLFSFCVLIFIRPFSGGLHFKSPSVCFLVSLIFFLMTVIILPHIFIPNFFISLIIGGISILLIFLNSPKPSPLRPIINPKRRQNFKYVSTVFSLILLIILLTFIHNSTFLACGIYTLFLQSLQLLGKGDVL
ncbi:accessory gene regulator B family protein [Defluviitalea phaphyphila]|uniref:accessory gene regulator B family protein n=1 Tax=Defluviitalea phaphyphila TaxID=1473580 RepID=UPI001FA78EA3